MRILIAGAGIGGLTLAALLRQRGITADIIDRAPSFDHAGYVLGLYPLGNRVLYGLSAFRAFASASESMDTYVVGAGNGREINRFDFKPLIEKYGAFRILARGDLLRILHRAGGAPAIRMGVSVSAITEKNERVSVRLSDGTESDYDLLVGADGIHSFVRKYVSPKTETFDTKWACWAWWKETGEFPSDTVFEQWGAGRFIGYYPTPSRIGMIAGAPARALGGTKVQGRKKRMMRVFARLKGRARDAVTAFPEDDREIFYWKLEDRRAQDWVKGRVGSARRCGMCVSADRGHRCVDGDGIGVRSGRRTFARECAGNSAGAYRFSKNAGGRAWKRRKTTAANFPG